MLENAMGEASASVAVVTALMRQKLSAAIDGEIDNYTDRLVEMADFQELVIDQRALVSYSLLVFVCKMAYIYEYKLWNKESWLHWDGSYRFYITTHQFWCLVIRLIHLKQSENDRCMDGKWNLQAEQIKITEN